MRAFAHESFGDTGSIREVDLPSPSANEVRVKVIAASVNPVDWKTGKGYLKDYLEHRFPLILGQDFAGVVDSVGAHVHDLKKGDAVFGGHGQMFMGRGTHAEYVVANTVALAPLPAGLEPPAAASIPLAGVTALMCVDAIGAGPGDAVLIVGAAGGVGSFAVQIAVARGAHVIAVGRAVNHEYLRKLGASETVDYENTDVVEKVRAIHPEPLDGIIDLASDADTVRRLSSLLRDGGTVASPVGTAPMDDPRIKGAFIVAQVTRERLEQLAGWLADGSLVIPEIRTFKLEDTSSAFRESEGGHVRGKLVVTP
ncbi:MAG TPA: NADP-dependent oxidoreductase [Gemmatimonadales bacterium]|nr:NADP-dependent oxidoreductase [Gemmatimonadales bacterium]